MRKLPSFVESQLEADSFLDHFMPKYEVAERHAIMVSAPAEVTFSTATEMDLRRSRIVRVILRFRELLLGSHPADSSSPSGLIAQTKAMGWGLLAEAPGHEIVMGAITQPWAADVVFRSVPGERFATHQEVDHVKIAWTLRSEPLSASTSVLVTETRVAACDSLSRARFLRYWRRFSPGIILIRLAMLRLVKKEAESRERNRSHRRHSTELTA